MSIALISPLANASNLLNWSNAFYIIGAVLTLAAAALVLYNKRAASYGKANAKKIRSSVLPEIVVIVAALVSLFGTVGAVHYGNVVSSLKDADLKRYEKDADTRISESNTKALEAQADTQRLENENLQMQGQLTTVGKSVTGLVNLTSQRILNPTRSDIDALRPFAGAHVFINVAGGDAESDRLKIQLGRWFQSAGLTANFGAAIGVGLASPLSQAGVHIIESDDSKSQQLSSSVQKVLSEHHIRWDRHVESSFDQNEKRGYRPAENSLVIEIGPKP